VTTSGPACRILLISGSLRQGSTNTALLRTARAVAPAGVATGVYEGLADLPHFNPDDDHDPLPVAVVALRSQIGEADALLFSTPEYAGALPGSFKNLLDWAIGDDHPRSIYNKPAAWINVSTTTGAVHAHESLRLVLGYAHARLVEAACVDIPVLRSMIGTDGLIGDPPTRTRLAHALLTLAEFACPAGSGASPTGP
jgi:chromate reductase, NAD(P)H dehydrogenase (quinone)